MKYFYRFICLAIRRLPEVYCVIAGTTCRRAGESATQRLAGRAISVGRAQREETDRNLPPLTFAPGCGKSGLAQAEHHLVADIARAVIQYWQTTGDESFIAHEGMALLLETAKF